MGKNKMKTRLGGSPLPTEFLGVVISGAGAGASETKENMHWKFPRKGGYSFYAYSFFPGENMPGK